VQTSDYVIVLLVLYIWITSQLRNNETSWLVLQPDCKPQVRIPPVRNARRTSCPIPSSECAQIPNFRTRSILNLWTSQCRFFERTSLQRTYMYVIPCQQQTGSSAVLQARHSALVLAAIGPISHMLNIISQTISGLCMSFR